MSLTIITAEVLHRFPPLPNDELTLEVIDRAEDLGLANSDYEKVYVGVVSLVDLLTSSRSPCWFAVKARNVARSCTSNPHEFSTGITHTVGAASQTGVVARLLLKRM